MAGYSDWVGAAVDPDRPCAVGCVEHWSRGFWKTQMLGWAGSRGLGFAGRRWGMLGTASMTAASGWAVWESVPRIGHWHWGPAKKMGPQPRHLQQELITDCFSAWDAWMLLLLLLLR